MAIVGGASLGSIASGQSENYPNSSYNFFLTASTSSYPTPVEYTAVGPFYPGTSTFGLVGFAADLSSVNVTNGLSNGSATVNITNGQGPFTIVWSNGTTTSGEITSTVTNLAPNTYTVDITSANGCSYSEVVVITGSTGIEDLFSSLEGVRIAPNPASGNAVSLNVEAHRGQRLSISVFNSLGQEVISTQSFEINQGANRLNIDLKSSLDNGLYALKITSENRVGSLFVNLRNNIPDFNDHQFPTFTS
ncbi:MAG: hypothetical protein ACI9FU_001063 [Granulosicoccus sp.]|jgi:hypothetical protein